MTDSEIFEAAPTVLVYRGVEIKEAKRTCDPVAGWVVNFGGIWRGVSLDSAGAEHSAKQTIDLFLDGPSHDLFAIQSPEDQRAIEKYRRDRTSRECIPEQ